jgi:hypothetical protein
MSDPYAALRPRCSNATWCLIGLLVGAATVAVLWVPSL